jgi:hypothetical protein
MMIGQVQLSSPFSMRIKRSYRQWSSLLQHSKCKQAGIGGLVTVDYIVAGYACKLGLDSNVCYHEAMLAQAHHAAEAAQIITALKAW